ncbi:hypothetical protein COJ85_31550 [Bacillus sp. AFS076308]|uniref:DUF3231 family protein n=1 Tax=unclassified Bacillus (in: firmicutes) TaxID=185979 RepID=UPI000BF65D36|nr:MULTISPECIES: DUF3231 family protein [unclassified Bacillus (in: firmicutes)]PFN78568.1 hypothetical protein COJ85_31550 [Bacillus sp. AFS076308]PGV48062.1 hypothetical protein COD92_27815 [Bacillus sp. AFS037270]
MEEEKNDIKIKLTSAEIASLWSTYMSDSAAVCIFEHFLEAVEDIDARGEIEFAINISRKHIDKIREIFLLENYFVPIGFSIEQDVNKKTPRLFSDIFYLYFLLNMGAGGLANYGMALQLSTRKDTVDFFSKAIYESVELKQRVTNIMLNKGIYIKPPYLDYENEKPVFVEKESFLRGWFGERRTLTSQEVSHLYLNLYNNQLGMTILIGFSQVAHTPEIRNYFIKGQEISRKFINILNNVLTESSIPAPKAWGTEVTKSTSPPYSEKLMMFLVGAISSIGIANYGGSMSLTLRHDLPLKYAKMLAESGSFAEDGASIMINNGWFERPPQSINRRELKNTK